jgi:hypothetical protein
MTGLAVKALLRTSPTEPATPLTCRATELPASARQRLLRHLRLVSGWPTSGTAMRTIRNAGATSTTRPGVPSRRTRRRATSTRGSTATSTPGRSVRACATLIALPRTAAASGALTLSLSMPTALAKLVAVTPRATGATALALRRRRPPVVSASRMRLELRQPSKTSQKY